MIKLAGLNPLTGYAHRPYVWHPKFCPDHELQAWDNSRKDIENKMYSSCRVCISLLRDDVVSAPFRMTVHMWRVLHGSLFRHNVCILRNEEEVKGIFWKMKAGEKQWIYAITQCAIALKQDWAPMNKRKKQTKKQTTTKNILNQPSDSNRFQ